MKTCVKSTVDRDKNDTHSYVSTHVAYNAQCNLTENVDE